MCTCASCKQYVQLCEYRYRLTSSYLYFWNAVETFARLPSHLHASRQGDCVAWSRDAVTESGISCIRIVDRTAEDQRLCSQVQRAFLGRSVSQRCCEWSSFGAREARIKVHELELESLSSLEE